MIKGVFIKYARGGPVQNRGAMIFIGLQGEGLCFFMVLEGVGYEFFKNV